MRKNKLLLLLVLLMTAATGAWAQSTSSLVFEAACNGSGTADDNVVWTVTSDCSESTFESTKGIHYGTSNAQVQYIQLSTSGISGTITQVVVNASTATNVDATVGVTVGGDAFGGDAQSLSSTATDYTFTGSASGAIVVRVAKPSAAAKALYVKSIEVTYTSSGGSGATYTVAGSNAAMFGAAWDATNTANDMTKNGDGTYSITYTNVSLDANVEYRVVKDHDWSEAYPDGNRVINIAEAGTYTLTIHFNPTTHEVYETMPGSGSGAAYTVTLKEGTDDATSWQGKAGEGEYQALPLEGVAAGTAVTVKYNGTKKVKSVKAKKKAAAAVWDGDLSKLTAESTAEFATVTDGMTIKGAFAEGVNVKISIAEGATVTLDGVTINGVHNKSYKWAGINCLGDATIILSGTNTVKGFHQAYPGIHVPVDKTLTIQGSGSLTASSNGPGCGIGGGNSIACGNIVIAGGTITATGGESAAGIGGGYGSCGNISITGGTITANGGSWAAGIGSGFMGSCGDISITGGTINATGGEYAAGIGSGCYGSCGDITITDGVTSVTTTKGNDAPYSIGAGGEGGTCGTVTIGGTVYWQDNAAVNGGDTYLATSPLDYPPTPATVTTAPTATTGDIAAGSETALVSGGAATGGTMMYKVTTTNTQPTSTEGFSADVPTAKTLAAGTYYVWYYVEGDASHTDSEISATGIEVTIAAAALTYPIALSAVTSDYIGSVIATDGYVYATAADATAASKTAVAKICYVSGSNGLALALEDVSEEQLTWDNSADENDGKTAAEWCSAWNTSKAVKDAEWMLASKDQWTNMITAAGSYTDLRDGFSSVGGSNLKSDSYWSSTEDDSYDGRAWYYYFGQGVWSSVDKDCGFLVRACLAW